MKQSNSHDALHGILSIEGAESLQIFPMSGGRELFEGWPNFAYYRIKNY